MGEGGGHRGWSECKGLGGYTLAFVFEFDAKMLICFEIIAKINKMNQIFAIVQAKIAKKWQLLVLLGIL